MSRAIPSSLLSALIGDKIQPYFAVELMFDTRTITGVDGNSVSISPLRLWTGLGDKTINVQGSDQVFTGTGSLLSIGDLEEVGDLSSKSVEFTLSGIPNSIISLALQEPYQRRVARLYLGEQSDSSVVEIFSGKMDKMTIIDEAETSTIALTVESKLIELERSSGWRYTNENQQSRYDGDTFFLLRTVNAGSNSNMGKADLNFYLDKMIGVPFEWGVHDCFTFTNGAFRAMYGVGYADDWEGLYMQSNGVHPKGPRSMRDDFGFNSLDEGLATKLTRVERPLFGSLVTTKKGCRWITGVALGISIGSRAVFLNMEGLIRLNIEDVESAWVCR